MRVWVCLTTPKFVSWNSVCMPEIKLIIWFLLMIYFCFWVWIALFFYSRLFSTLIWLAYQTVYKLPWEIYPILINLYWTNLTTTIHNGSLTFFLSSMAISIQKAILIYPVVSEVMTIKELYNINDWQQKYETNIRKNCFTVYLRRNDFARSGTICTISKTWKTPVRSVTFSKVAG